MPSESTQEPRSRPESGSVGNSPYSAPNGSQGLPDVPSDPSKISGETLARVALSLLKDGELDLGIKYLEAAVARMPLLDYPERWLRG
jgi:hypothetical protein